ncbi:hypothetical protein FRC08_014703 [Ceratobasidium sp. 394]|nr:hypothetical protein FRC08_014703 [Ceratobasidium sp. 394]
MVSVGSSSARAGSSKHTASAGGLQDIDEEMIELSDDEDEVKIVPKGKKRGAALERVGKGKSNKPKCSDYFGMARKLIDETFYRVLAHLGHHGMFPDDQREYDRLIRKSWLVVVKELGENPEKYPMEDEHETLVKVRIDSFRGRARVKIEPAIKKIYGLTGKPDKVIARVEKLQAGEFHKDPEVKGRAGNYQHPYLEECVREVFFIGRRPVGVLFPELYDPVPIPALAYVCAVIGFCISLYSTGVFVDARAESAMVAKFYKDHLPNLELFQECRPTKCEKYRALLYTESMKQAGKSAKVPKEERTGPGVLTATDFEDEDEDEEEGGDRSEADEKPRKAAPPVKSRPCAQKKPSRDVDEDEDEGKINSEAEEKPKKAAPPVKARSRAHKKPLWDEDEDEGENGSEADEQPKKVAPLVKSRPSAHKNSSRDEDKDEGESENGSEADEKQKKAAPLAKPRPRPRQKFPRDKDEDEGEEGSETDETPKKVASPAKACSSTHQKPASKLKPSSSESSDLSSESGSSSSDNGEDAGGGKRNADRDVARPEHGSTSSRAVNAATDDLEDAGVGGMDVDQDHDSQPPLPDKQAGGTVANVDNGGGDKGARRSSGGKSSIEQHRKPSASPNKRSSVELDEGSGVGGGERGTSADKEGGDEGGNGGSGGKARTGANQGGKKGK